LRSGIGTRPVLPLKGSCTGLAERHAPEVAVRSDEFEPQISFAFTATRRDHFALHRLSRVLVQQDDRLIRSELRVQRKQAPELTHRVRVRANDELLTIECLPIHTQGHRQRHTRRATPFDAPIIHNLHVHTIARHGSRWKALPRVNVLASQMLLRSAISKKRALRKSHLARTLERTWLKNVAIQKWCWMRGKRGDRC
jgi:hypothetical protein